MNTIAAHKGHLEELLDDLSGCPLISGITFVALLNAYITRVEVDSELTDGPNIDSKLRGLLRATQNFETTPRLKNGDGAKEIKNNFSSSSQNRSAPDNFRGKPKYLFHGMVK